MRLLLHRPSPRRGGVERVECARRRRCRCAAGVGACLARRRLARVGANLFCATGVGAASPAAASPAAAPASAPPASAPPRARSAARLSCPAAVGALARADAVALAVGVDWQAAVAIAVGASRASSSSSSSSSSSFSLLPCLFVTILLLVFSVGGSLVTPLGLGITLLVGERVFAPPPWAPKPRPNPQRVWR